MTIKSKKNIFIIIFFILILLVNGCVGKRSMEYINSNPTSYTFNLSAKELNIKIKNLFSKEIKFKLENSFPLELSYNGKYASFFILENSNFQNNAKIANKMGLLDLYVKPSFHWNSEIYTFSYFNNKSTITNGDFIIKLTAQSNNSTKVSIIPIHLKAKTYALFRSTHGLIPLTQSIQSTSIEEYSFLKYIGCYLGIEMPEIKRPKQFIYLNNFCTKNPHRGGRPK